MVDVALAQVTQGNCSQLETLASNDHVSRSTHLLLDLTGGDVLNPFVLRHCFDEPLACLLPADVAGEVTLDIA
ncbi:hypothetical protein D3C76_1600530 [compost metagenome]